jgi:hypothetical protein
MNSAVPDRYDLAPLARLETNWCPPWLIARVAQHGPCHYGNGAPMDDSHIIGGTSGAFWMAAADGVGSQEKSRHGSRAACLALDAYLGRKLSEGAAPSRHLMVEAFHAAHAAIQALADTHRDPAHLYATTLAAVLIRGNTIIAAAVGDSGIAVGTQHEDEKGAPKFMLTPFCSAPQPGNATYTIADPNWPHYIATNESHAPHITTVIVATDGANNFFLGPSANGTSFQTDWPAALEGRVRELTPLTYVNFFAHFIQYQPPENHDDRTLVVAYRPPRDIAPPAAKPR